MLCDKLNLCMSTEEITVPSTNAISSRQYSCPLDKRHTLSATIIIAFREMHWVHDEPVFIVGGRSPATRNTLLSEETASAMGADLQLNFAISFISCWRDTRPCLS